MATDNYIKVRQGQRCTEFFFDSRSPISVSSAANAAADFAEVLSDCVLAEIGDAAPPPDLTVWAHGVPGLGDLRCVGGCPFCTAEGLHLVEDETEEDFE